MSRRLADNWSHPGHYQVDPYKWSWSKAKVMFYLQNSKVKVMAKVKHIGHIWGLEFNRYVCCLFRGNGTTFGWDIGNSIFDQGHGQGQTWWSHLKSSVQLICLLCVSWQSDHFWLRYRKFYIWPWNFKVKAMAKIKPDCHIWALDFNRYICFSFLGNRTIFGWEIW